VAGAARDANDSIPKLDLELHQSGSRVAASLIGRGPLAMFVHGWGGSSLDMLPLANAFAQSGWRSVVFDMPGHGRSAGRESSLVEFMRAMRAVTSAVGAPEIIVGHSIGGAAAVLGITELALPVRGAVLVAPAPGPAYYVDRFTRSIGLPAGRRGGMVRHLVERIGRSMESLDALVAARSAEVPALIFHDPADREVPFEFAERMLDAWRGSRLVVAPSLGHKRILRDPAVIASAVEYAAGLAGQRTSRTA
jgi:pimeloyl-ACP methyl ester carboxylesterase